jgi:hypothetical protein
MTARQFKKSDSSQIRDSEVTNIAKTPTFREGAPPSQVALSQDLLLEIAVIPCRLGNLNASGDP